MGYSKPSATGKAAGPRVRRSGSGDKTSCFLLGLLLRCSSEPPPPVSLGTSSASPRQEYAWQPRPQRRPAPVSRLPASIAHRWPPPWTTSSGGPASDTARRTTSTRHPRPLPGDTARGATKARYPHSLPDGYHYPTAEPLEDNGEGEEDWEEGDGEDGLAWSGSAGGLYVPPSGILFLGSVAGGPSDKGLDSTVSSH